MDKNELLIAFKSNLHLKKAWTISEFALLMGYSPAYIKKQLETGELKKFQPKGRSVPKITPQASDEWVENNSFYENQELHLNKNRH